MSTTASNNGSPRLICGGLLDGSRVRWPVPNMDTNGFHYHYRKQYGRVDAEIVLQAFAYFVDPDFDVWVFCQPKSYESVLVT